MALERDTLLHKRYRVVEILGQGGMGSVYRAIDENLGVHVAVKENLFATEEYARQFRLEAVILAGLRHPNLPRVSDHFGVGEQGQYLVMDFIEGEDLRQRMERLGTIGEDDAIQIGAAMCDALGYLHSRTPPILHRDLKPGNVKLTPDGHIYLVDFGLAKLVHGGQATTSGARAMTPGYSPPEQYGTARTDPRTDIYSLGATLYAALSGLVPEDGLARAMDNAQLTPLRKRNPKISRRLAAAIEKAMAIDPSDRFQEAEDFKRALLNAKSKTLQLGAGLAVTSPPDSPEPGAVGESQALRNGSSGPLPIPSPASVEELPFVSPRKRQLERERRQRRVLTRLVLISLAGVVAALPAVAPGILPASLSLLISALRLPSQSVTGAADLGAFTPTAALATTPLAVTQNAAAATARTPTGAVTSAPEPTIAGTATMLPPVVSATRWLAGGSPATPTGGGSGQLAFASSRNDGIPQIFFAGLSGLDLVQLTDLTNGACQPAWSPDGTRLAFVSPCGGVGEIIYEGRLHLINADGTGLMELPSAPGGDFDPAWSPDGTRLAFTSLRSGIMNIYVLDLQDNSVMPLTSGSADLQARQPAWSPDGRQIAFAVKRFGKAYQIWLMSSSGGGQHQVVRSGTQLSDYLPAWSPDGKSILFSQRRIDATSLPYLMVLSLDGDTGEQGIRMTLAGLPAEDASYSPDGRWLACEGLGSGQDRDVFVVMSGEGEPTPLSPAAGLDFDPAWRPFAVP